MATTTTAAAVLTPDQVEQVVVRPLIEQSVATQVSTVVRTDTHRMRVPIVTADPTAAWVAEGAEIPVSDAALGEVVITPAKLSSIVPVTEELAADSDTSVQMIGDSLTRDLTRKLDQAYFGNVVTDGPSGLLSLASTAVDAGDAWTNLDWAEAAKVEAEKLATALGAFVCNPTTALKLAQLKEQTGSNKALLGSDPTAPTARVIGGLPLYVSSASTLANDVVWGIPKAHSLVVIRKNATVVTDNSVFFTSERIAIKGTIRVGFGFTYPAAVVKVATTP